MFLINRTQTIEKIKNNNFTIIQSNKLCYEAEAKKDSNN